MGVVFPLNDGITNQRLRRVHPLMQKDIETVLLLAQAYPISVILFGSSITTRCNSRSDIDLAITTKNGEKNTFFDFMSKVKEHINTPIDFVYCNELVKNGSMWKELCRTGYVLVNNLEREADL